MPAARRRAANPESPDLASRFPDRLLHVTAGSFGSLENLGHRPSADFDFFAFEPFAPNDLLQRVPYLKGATIRQSAPDTLTVSVERGGPVQVLFFGGLDLGQVAL